MLIIVSEGVGGDDCQERGRLIFTLRPRCQPQLAGKDGSHHHGNQPPALQLSKIIMPTKQSASPEIQLGSWGGEQTLTWFLLSSCFSSTVENPPRKRSKEDSKTFYTLLTQTCQRSLEQDRRSSRIEQERSKHRLHF